MSSNHYRALGISPDAPPEQVKRAYRELARRYHPDRHPTDPDAAERWKEILQAYEVLSDPRKRRVYDVAHGSGIPASDVLADLLRDVRPMMDASGPGGTAVMTPPGVEIPLERLWAGGTAWLPAPEGVRTAEGDLVEVDLPPGVADGDEVEGRTLGGEPVRLELRVTDHAVFSRSGADVVTSVRVGFGAALFGGTVEVPTVDGGKDHVTVRPLEGRRLVRRIANEGLPRKDGGRGDLVVELEGGLFTPDATSLLVPLGLAVLFLLLWLAAGSTDWSGDGGALGMAQARVLAAVGAADVLRGSLLLALVVVAGLLGSWLLSFVRGPVVEGLTDASLFLERRAATARARLARRARRGLRRLLHQAAAAGTDDGALDAGSWSPEERLLRIERVTAEFNREIRELQSAGITSAQVSRRADVQASARKSAAVGVITMLLVAGLATLLAWVHVVAFSAAWVGEAAALGQTVVVGVAVLLFALGLTTKALGTDESAGALWIGYQVVVWTGVLGAVGLTILAYLRALPLLPVLQRFDVLVQPGWAGPLTLIHGVMGGAIALLMAFFGNALWTSLQAFLTAQTRLQSLHDVERVFTRLRRLENASTRVIAGADELTRRLRYAERDMLQAAHTARGTGTSGRDRMALRTVAAAVVNLALLTLWALGFVMVFAIFLERLASGSAQGASPPELGLTLLLTLAVSTTPLWLRRIVWDRQAAAGGPAALPFTAERVLLYGLGGALVLAIALLAEATTGLAAFRGDPATAVAAAVVLASATAAASLALEAGVAGLLVLLGALFFAGGVLLAFLELVLVVTSLMLARILALTVRVAAGPGERVRGHPVGGRIAGA